MATQVLNDALGTSPSLVRGFAEKTGLKERADYSRTKLPEAFEGAAKAEEEAARRKFEIDQGQIKKEAEAEGALAAQSRQAATEMEAGVREYEEFAAPEIKASDYAKNAALRLVSALIIGGVGGASGKQQLMAIREMQDAEDRGQKERFASAKLKFDEADRARKDHNQRLKDRFERMLNLLSKDRNAAMVEAKLIEAETGNGLIAAKIRAGKTKEAYDMFNKAIESSDKVNAELEKQRTIFEEKKALKMAPSGAKMGGGGAGGGGGSPTKLEKGEVWNPEKQRIEAVPGSKLYVKQADEHGKDYRGLVSVETKTNSAISKIKKILDPKRKDAFDANFSGGIPYSGYVTGAIQQDAINLNKEIDSLKADMKSAGLELIRQGGSIGQITEREWPILEQMIASISPALSRSAAVEALGRVEAYLERIKANAQDFYVNEYEDTQYYNPTREISRVRGNRQLPVATKADIQATMSANPGMTEDQVKNALRNKGFKIEGE